MLEVLHRGTEGWVRLLLDMKKIRPVRRLAKSLGLTRLVWRMVKDKVHIYPVDLPPLDAVEPDLDLLVLELPPRYIPMMPNGVAYLDNLVRRSGIRHQTIDANIIIYHRFHQRRCLDGMRPVVTAGGYRMADDPWDLTRMDEWEKPEVLDYFRPDIEEILRGMARRPPKAVGVSVHAGNRTLAREFVRLVRERFPGMLVLVGGYDCVYANSGPHLFPDFDYMAINEAEATLEPLLRAIARGERPKDLPGILSRFDTPGRLVGPTPLLDDLNSIELPRYGWIDLRLYQDYRGSSLVPIILSRGCEWSKCTFCSECFHYRYRDAGRMADEIEYFYRQGFDNFTFCDSDVNGEPQALYDTCSEVIRRGLKVHFTAQLRINKHNSVEYFRHLRRAGFTDLRFGVDGWSKRAVKLQMKGYTMQMVYDNLKAACEAGIRPAVNMVIGVPGETEEDIDEMIENVARCKPWISLVENINTLILGNGSMYYNDPERYKIRFRGDKSEIYRTHPYYIPIDLWYSEEPYIDQAVRVRRLERICEGLVRLGVPVGPFARSVVEKIKGSRVETLAA